MRWIVESAKVINVSPTQLANCSVVDLTEQPTKNTACPVQAMQPQFYRQVFSVQSDHWWGRNRRKLSFDLLKRFGVPQGCRHLDLGCGTGQNLGLLQSLIPSLVVGVDVSPIALDFAWKTRSRCALVQADINNALPFADETFDVVSIFNVLYHQWIGSEGAVLKEVRRVLRSGGLLLITELAFRILAGATDIADMAARRYRLRPFTELLRTAQFDVVFSNYFTSFGVPIILGAKAMGALLGKSPTGDDVADMRLMHPIINTALYGAARIDAALIKASVPIPFGTTVVCVGRKR
jgi:SAM-dependent methyltransferase